ncbi:hypothetical protein L208DRAFT_1251830, partial [Tricholoma matsutake]
FELPPPYTPLADIRKSLADYTHLPEYAFKLIHAGAVMKDDSAPISAYHIRPNSTIALIGTDDLHHPSTLPLQKTEQSVVSAIQSELNGVRNTLLPDLDSFLQDPTRDLEHRRLAELLLQALLRLDAVVPEATWEDARKERKDAVREVQAMLDRLDDAWATRPT